MLETTVKLECTVLIKHGRELTEEEACRIAVGLDGNNPLNEGCVVTEMLNMRKARLTRYFNQEVKGERDG